MKSECEVCGSTQKLTECGEYTLCAACEDVATTCYDDECDGRCYDGLRVPTMIASAKGGERG